MCREVLQNVEVVCHSNSKQELLILEALHIKSKKTILNEQEKGRDRILKIF